jgi:hypothetical protein
VGDGSDAAGGAGLGGLDRHVKLAPTVINAQDDDGVVLDFKNDAHPALETDSPYTRTDVIALGPAMWGSPQRQTFVDDPLKEAICVPA